MSQSLSPSQKLSAAIMRVVEPPVAIAPYFGAVLRGLVRREMTPEMEAAMESFGQKPTLGVTADGVLLWSSKFVESIDVMELTWSLIHEVGHIVLKHSARAAAQGVSTVHATTAEEASDARLWNIAGDASWNEELRKMNPAKLPDWWVMPETLLQAPGLIVEERYQLLKKDVEKIKSKMPKPGTGSGGCGSCSGNPLPGEPESGKKNGDGRSEAEMARMRKQVAQDIQGVKDRGKVPDSLNRWADSYLSPPKVDWRTKLARTLRGAVAYRSGQSDFTWSKMSRRQAGVGYGIGRPVVPALHSPVPSVGIIVDTSGSVSQRGLAAAAAEISGILSAVGASVTVVAVDADVQNVKECKTIGDAIKSFKGGGGTIMTPGWEALSKMKNRPSVVVCLTDGFIGDGYPHVEPAFCTNIWVVIEGNGQPCCPWGDFIAVEAEG